MAVKDGGGVSTFGSCLLPGIKKRKTKPKKQQQQQQQKSYTRKCDFNIFKK